MKKFFHPDNRKIWMVFGLTLIIAIGALAIIPKSIPIHFDSQGSADSFADKWAIFLVPGIIFLLIIFAEVLRELDPKSENYKMFEPYYYQIHFAVSLLLLVMQLYTIAYILGWQVNISRLMVILVGVLFIFLGNIMPKFKHNYFVGIRTKWTIASEKVWFLTHRLGGKVFVLGGFVILMTALFWFSNVQIILFSVIGLMVLFPFGASLYYYQKYER